jgi:hypothetical protein
MIHTQDSAVLEEGKGYSLEKVKAFFNGGNLLNNLKLRKS